MTTTCKCKRCGYEWAARVEKPKACPECKDRRWNVGKPQDRECMACGQMVSKCGHPA